MFRRNYKHWIRCIPYTWFTMVPFSFLVLPIDNQLLLLLGKSGGILRSIGQSDGTYKATRRSKIYVLIMFTGFLESISKLPSICFLLSLLWWICVVRTEFSKKVLHEAVFSIRVDTCCSPDCCDTILFDYQKYF